MVQEGFRKSNLQVSLLKGSIIFHDLYYNVILVMIQEPDFPETKGFGQNLRLFETEFILDFFPSKMKLFDVSLTKCI